MEDTEIRQRFVLRSLDGEGFMTTIPNKNGYCVGSRDEAMVFSSLAHAETFNNFFNEVVEHKGRFEPVRVKLRRELVMPTMEINNEDIQRF